MCGFGFRLSDVIAAFSLLSRLPVPADHELAGRRASIATWAYPLVGGVLGAVAAISGTLCLWVGVSSGISAALGLATLVLLTGAMHEDGLADCADGLGGGRDKEHALSIMKDSRIGAYGASALILALLARWSGLETLTTQGLFWPMIAAGAASRLPMVWAMTLMPSARSTGLSAGVGAPPLQSVLAASGIAVAICLLALGWGGIAVVFWALVGPLPLFWLAYRRLNGQTGDILGGSQQLAEIAAFATVLALI